MSSDSLSGLRCRRVDKGVSVTYQARWELMFCWSGFWPCWEVTRTSRGFLRLCLGRARLFLVWPEGPVSK